MSERAHDVPGADATIVLPTPGRRRFGFAAPLERRASGADPSALGGLNRIVAQEEKLAQEQDDFQKVFGADFMGAYQAQLRRLKGGC